MNIRETAERLERECFTGTGLDVERLVRSAMAEGLKMGAEVCEGLRDLREHERAAVNASADITRGDAEDMLCRLRHESTVRLYNAALDKSAAALRAKAEEISKPCS